MNNHSILVANILLELGSRKDLMIWKNSTGVAVADGRHVRYGLKGSPDIIGVIEGGIFLGIEVKTGSATQSPHQKKFQKRFEQLGGLYIVARSTEDIKKIPIGKIGI